jgi:hypothetical protein
MVGFHARKRRPTRYVPRYRATRVVQRVRPPISPIHPFIAAGRRLRAETNWGELCNKSGRKRLIPSPGEQIRGLFVNPNGVIREARMIADLKRTSRLADDNSNEHERTRREKALDDALKDTFPASDPLSVEQPAPRDVGRAKALTTVDVRQGITGHNVRYVLFFGLAGATIALTLVYFLYFV